MGYNRWRIDRRKQMEVINLKLALNQNEQVKLDRPWYKQFNLNPSKSEELNIANELVDPDWLWIPQGLKQAWATTKILIDAPVLQPDCNAIQAISLLKQNSWQMLLKTMQLLTNLVFEGQLALNGLQVLAANENMILINQIPTLQLVAILVEKLQIDFIYVINDEQLIKVKNWLKQAKGHWHNYQVVKINESDQLIDLKKMPI